MLDETDTFLKAHDRFNQYKSKSVRVYRQDGREWMTAPFVPDHMARQGIR